MTACCTRLIMDQCHLLAWRWTMSYHWAASKSVFHGQKIMAMNSVSSVSKGASPFLHGMLQLWPLVRKWYPEDWKIMFTSHMCMQSIMGRYLLSVLTYNSLHHNMTGLLPACLDTLLNVLSQWHCTAATQPDSVVLVSNVRLASKMLQMFILA